MCDHVTMTHFGRCRTSQEVRGLKYMLGVDLVPKNGRTSQEVRGLKCAITAEMIRAASRTSQEVRGLKCFGRCLVCFGRCRTSQEVRGLKLCGSVAVPELRQASHLARGAWIEISVLSLIG